MTPEEIGPGRSRSATSPTTLTPDEALEILRRPGTDARLREAELRATGYPAYTTSIGWLGYPDDKVRRLAREGVAAGWTHFKLKVGADLADDIRRAAIMREEIGPDRILMVDANQAWDVDEAIDGDAGARAVSTAVDRGADQPRRRPRTRPDRAGDRAARDPRRDRASTATTGSCSSSSSRPRRSASARSTPVAWAVSTRSWPSCCSRRSSASRSVPHAGGVGLCEYVQHLAIFDYIARQRLARGPGRRVRGPPARAFRGPGRRPRRSLRRPRGAGLQHHDAARVPRTLRVPGWPAGGDAGRSPEAASRHDRLRARGQDLPHHRRRLRASAARRRSCSPREGADVAVADVDARVGATRPWRMVAAASDREASGRRGVHRRRDRRGVVRRRSPWRPSPTRSARIDVLFNNAGIAGVGTVEETSLELWERVMAVNVRGVFLVAKAVLPVMVAAGRGSIINMSSTIAEIGLARRASYAASKGAVLAAHPADAGRLRGARHPGQRPAARARSTRRSSTATSRRATTTRSPASSRSRSAS